MKVKELAKHYYNFSPQDNGGEGLFMETIFYDNGDGIPDGVYTNQTLTLRSYGNSASINLFGIQITPEKLRELADQLEGIQKNLKDSK